MVPGGRDLSQRGLERGQADVGFARVVNLLRVDDDELVGLYVLREGGGARLADVGEFQKKGGLTRAPHPHRPSSVVGLTDRELASLEALKDARNRESIPLGNGSE